MARSELGHGMAICAAGLLVFVLLYSLFFALSRRFPYIQPGGGLVSRLKHDLARNGRPFVRSSGLKVMAFGKSKVLSGFIPSLFDNELAAAGVSVESYNFGLPGDERFIADLERMASRGTAPDVVLLTAAWPANPESGPDVFHFVNHDRQIMDSLFPFRNLLRDFFVMFAEVHGSPTGFRRSYLESERVLRQVEKERGYYFIARQSHYKNDELPAEFKDPKDTPSVTSPRTIPRGPTYRRLISLFAAHHIKCIFIPIYRREGELAPPPPLNLEAARALEGQPQFGIVGPDYFIYPNRLFSDPVHANPGGAEVYTRAVASLVARWLREPASLK